MVEIATASDRLLSRDAGWQFMYRVRPYLDAVPEEDLRLRMADILRNLYTLTAGGKIGALAPGEGGLLWLQKFSDISLEYDRRNLHIEAQVRPEDIPFNREALDLVKANSELVPHLARTPVFCRYGELRWMTALRDRGELLLSPASHYRTLNNDTARNDDELALHTYISPYDYDLGLVNPSIATLMPHRSWGVVEHQKPCDYYLFCGTVSFDFRYFIDFGVGGKPADACVLIYNQEEFARRLLAGVRSALPGWRVSFGGVNYVDPFCVQLLPNVGDEIFYFKHFRFFYQREHRLVAVAPTDTEAPLSRLNVTLGSIADISDLVTIRTDSGAEAPGQVGAVS